jgi:hypothetical protein
MSVTEPPRPPSAPLTEVLGGPPPSPRVPWWQHGWGAAVIGVVGLLIGIGVGGASGSKTKTEVRTVTQEGAARTVTHTAPGHTRTVIRTRTVTRTNTVTAKAAAASSPAESEGEGTGANCEPGYSPCLPRVGDLNCDEIPASKKPVQVTGSDPYRLDADHNGVGCQSG